MEYNIEDLFEIIRNGVNIKQGFSGGYPITRIETISTGEINRNKMGYAGITDIAPFEKYILEHEDILMSHINSEKHLGKSALYEKLENEQIIHGMNLLGLRVKSKILLPKFAIYLFQTQQFRKSLSKIVKKSVNQASFAVNDLKKIKVDIPSLEQQKYIVSVLDSCNRFIEKRQSQITALDELTQSLFIEMFGAKNQSELTEVSEIAEVIGGLQVSGKRKNNPIEVPYLRVGNVYRNALALDEIKLIRVTESELKRTILKKHDILVVEGHGNKKEVGRASRWNGEILNCVHQNHLIKIRVANEHVRPEYLCSFINSIDGKIYMYKNSNTTSGLNTISTNVVRKMKVYIPPLREQDKFIALKDKINNKKTKMSESLVQINSLYNSLLQKAFKGELF
ncbi:hypothetical protein J41TS12_38330 [Paenibacillus antibioticophila]|uniref:Type I restriction modification DNA specificity domain-containing protein n=1 Tax=Paenibacillus antibioticophila TaxID=1274374 RepID=A0A919XTP2_9BACL|nr:restriction endonuclease subunit S [Paenibacillus antibioticophila]GIO38972.1 hypothetical protein J41TS12_38330 [Paenibacillus antibioticophila]